MSHATPHSPHRAAFAALLLCGVFGGALADVDDESQPAWPAAPDLTAVHTHIVTPAAAVNADVRSNNELVGISYRWWLSRGRTDLGLGLGTVGHVAAPADGPFNGGPTRLIGSVPTVTVGVRYRMSNESAVYADASGAQGLGNDGTARYVNAKLGMEWTTVKPKLGFENGALGIHFDSGYRMTLRARHGGIGAYLRGKF
ncbi:MAG TPA: hypothetical protein VJ608_07230 [Albitalea sp.]|nr:hypothetical protein [Albitalea sp.]